MLCVFPQLKKQFPTLNLKIPAKRIFGDNFDPGILQFLDFSWNKMHIVQSSLELVISCTYVSDFASFSLTEIMCIYQIRLSNSVPYRKSTMLNPPCPEPIKSLSLFNLMLCSQTMWQQNCVHKITEWECTPKNQLYLAHVWPIMWLVYVVRIFFMEKPWVWSLEAHAKSVHML